MSNPRVFLAIAALALAGCTPAPTPRSTATMVPSTAPTQLPQPSDSPEVPPTVTPAQVDIYPGDIQIRIVTTSDWTTVRFVDGPTLHDHEILFSSPEATEWGFEQDGFFLSQPIGRAAERQSVGLDADLAFTDASLSGDLVLEIDRGHLGATTVEIHSDACGPLDEVVTLNWDGVQPAGENTQIFRIPVSRLIEPGKNEYTVIAQLNFWYHGPGPHGGFENSLGERTTPLTPLLGETYIASDPDVVYQQIEWAVEYGVDAFSIEWTTPRGIGCCGSMEDTLDDVFLKSPNIHKVRWAIFYDFVLRLAQTSGLERYVGTFDFDEPAVFDTFVSDFRHFAEKYFGHPQYLTIDERPVIYIWATGAYVGNLEGALREAREEVARLGYDVFIVGDEVLAGHFDPYHASLFDGNTTFTFLIGGLDFSSWADVADAAADVDRTFGVWRDNLRGLRVIDREETVNFQPAWAPQYDDRFFVPDQGTYVPAMSKEQVVEMAEVARKHAEPVGSRGQQLVWLNTWNNWAETTTVEPTANLGSKYPAGNYQFDMLEVVREVFGPETYGCEIP